MKRQHPKFDDNMLKELKDLKEAQAYLDVALQEYEEDGNYAAFLLALRRVAEAQGGMSDLARRSDLNRRNLYAALSETGQPRLDTIGAVLQSLGLRFSIARAVKLPTPTPSPANPARSLRGRH